MSRSRFQFGQVVIVENGLIGVVCKTWESRKRQSFDYEVYVRSYNSIQEYPEENIQHYIYSKELSEQEKEFY